MLKMTHLTYLKTVTKFFQYYRFWKFHIVNSYSIITNTGQPQKYENCQYMNENYKKECGIRIVSERLCDELRCCFNPSALVQCYKPVMPPTGS